MRTGMPSSDKSGPPKSDLTELYHLAFSEFGAECLWSRKPVRCVTPQHARIIAKTLKQEGGADAYRLARLIEEACAAATKGFQRKGGSSANWKVRQGVAVRAVARDRSASPNLECESVPYPVVPATNKILAAADRGEVRDAVDLRRVEEEILPLGPVAWAAARKSPERSAEKIIGQIRRRARFQQQELDRENLSSPLSAADLNTWLRMACDRAEGWIESIPP